ncbi:VapC toxin family PIN domain ribonuclease [Sinorhizobium sp. A49]|uniref:type II toxin-antitoxin system VapC family toxin n=1 Tax=Sinorhizobium sp. A49 TaxID=1945861 RepID=UPI0009879FFD|nr:type II toxin-antitoxin system VapC family toxin [Sinorhizobium sp. A49]OOG63116.1 VapC toxin family PIN domain ribonuclease [Sinorhizobium sp. A49]
MTAYLLDTNVVSLLSPSRTETATGLIAWLDKAEDTTEFFLSVVTVHEIERGIMLLERKGATAKANGLRRWMDGLFLTYEDRILSIDAAVSAMSGKLEAEAIASGHSPGMADALIAGTAKAHDLTVVTLNLRHFEPFGIDLMAAPV